MEGTHDRNHALQGVWYAATMCIRSIIVGVLGLSGLVGGCQWGPREGTSGPSLPTERTEWAIAIHGGAGTIDPNDPEGLAASYRDSLRRALDEGTRRLAAGESALDVCEAVVRLLEDDPLFNAGRGAALTERGEAELDAAIMDGPTLKAGAVGGVTTVKNPVSLARRVMQQTRYILLVAGGAERFADAHGAAIERVPNSYFITPRRQRMLDEVMAERARAKGAAMLGAPEPEARTGAARCGTVGCVALDMQGRLAAATSTGGLTGKMPGRIGDTPQIGAGTYADSRVAVSGTGTGEQFIRHGIARDLAARVEHLGETVQQAADHEVFRVLNPDDGGVIALDAHGNIAMPFSTVGMYRAAGDSRGLRLVAIWKESGQ